MKRILALDGGGIRGVFSLAILQRIERLFRTERNNPQLVLRDCFDFFAGTSTGAIIAALLAWGKSTDEIIALYRTKGSEMFTPSSFMGRRNSKFDSGPIAAMFRHLFGDETLGTKRLWDPADPAAQKYLLIVMRNASTGAAWPVCNNPKAKYNDTSRPDNNLQAPLWQLLRGSTAAPTFFRPQEIKIGDRTDQFVDGGMTPYNNPALIAALMATLPAYNIGWQPGVDNLQVVSLGTGIQRTQLRQKKILSIDVGFLDGVEFAAKALLDAVAIEQDMLCRVLGRCDFGAPIDSEVETLSPSGLFSPAEKKFSYLRYNRLFLPLEIADIEKRTGQPFQLDNIGLLEELIQLGTAYADANVRPDHFFPPR
jgi:hypothetical protein